MKKNNPTPEIIETESIDHMRVKLSSDGTIPIQDGVEVLTQIIGVLLLGKFKDIEKELRCDMLIRMDKFNYPIVVKIKKEFVDIYISKEKKTLLNIIDTADQPNILGEVK